MKVTSMLSNGYLQPLHNVKQAAEEERTSKERALSEELSANEQQILARERALKNGHGHDAKASTTYRYSIGPDGRRYITGAYVSIEGKADSDGPDSSGGSDVETEAAVRELKRAEQEVIAHEAAHQAAGGALTGAATYSYTQGPDGRSYITGGEVSIHIPVSSDPEKTLRDMEQVQRAALAPGNPSGQDLSVAGKAAAAAAQARQELAAKNREDKEESALFSPGVSSVKADLFFERLHKESLTEEKPSYSAIFDPVEAYGRNASNKGLWTLSLGFELIPKFAALESGFDIAA